MLTLVENVRRKQIAWVMAILDYRKWKPSRLASEAGVSHSTLSKFLNDPDGKAQLNSYTIEKIAAVGGIEPYDTEPAQRPRGFAENEAEPWQAATGDAIVEAAVKAAKGGKNHIDAWVMRSRALEHEGYLPGDILMIDLNAEPRDGDAVCAQVYDKGGRAETVMRIYEHPFLVAASGERATRRPLLVDNDHVVIRGVVVTSFRPRRAA